MKDQARVGGKQCADRSARDASGAGCRWFLDVYSDYRDNRLDSCSRNLAIAHIADCPRCRRYDRVLRTGVAVLRDEESASGGQGLEVATLRDLAWRQERTESHALGMAGSGMTTAGLVLVALVLGAIAWFPLFAPGLVELELEPVVATAPAPAPPPLLHPRPHPLFPAPSATLFSHYFPTTLFPHPVPHPGPLSFPGRRLSFPGPRPPLAGDAFRPVLSDYGVWLTRPPPGAAATVVDHD